MLLLKWFLLNPGHPFSIDELIDLGWPEKSRKQAIGGVHVAIHYLRRMLEPDLPPGVDSSFVRRSGSTFYRFEPGESWWTDVDEVVRLFDRARCADRQLDSATALFCYHRVVARPLHRLLEDDAQSERLATYRLQFKTLCAHSLVRLIHLHRERGEFEEALEYAYQMSIVDPFHELAATVIAESHLSRVDPAQANHRLHSFLESGAGPSTEVGQRDGDLRALCDRVVHRARSGSLRIPRQRDLTTGRGAPWGATHPQPD